MPAAFFGGTGVDAFLAGLAISLWASDCETDSPDGNDPPRRFHNTARPKEEMKRQLCCLSAT
jgi:hypothetical protein